MAEMGKGRQQNSQEKQSGMLAGEGMQIQCDVNGCVIVPIPRDAAGTNGITSSIAGQQAPKTQPSKPTVPKDFQLHQGAGYKLGYDRGCTNPREYSAVVGGKGWSVGLTTAEYQDFVKLLRNLRHSVTTLQICGEWGEGQHETDEATLEMKTERVWMQGRAPQKRLSALQDLWRRRAAGQSNNGNTQAAFALRFVISSEGQREVEGSFSAETVMSILEHLDATEGSQAAPEALQLQGVAT
jgi:hypothetical protein